MRALLAGVLATVAVTILAAAAPRATGNPTSLSAHPRVILTPATLKSLRQRAAGSSASWKALKEQCDAYLKGKVEWPDGNDYPDFGSIGEGYQGSGYLAAVANVGLCYQVVRTSNSTLAAKYAAKGRDILTKMSAPYGAGQHGENPIRDDGYGIRNYGSGMGIGFDWLYPALSSSLKARVDTSATKWLTVFKKEGFENDFPQGNYFAGYYAAEAFAGLAMAGATTHGTALWNDWLKRLQGTMVQPYYAANLSGGGWPEGWNYGPFGALNMSWATLAAKSGAGLDLVHSTAKPFTYPLTTPRYLVYFTWPDLKTLEDSGFVYEGDNPTPAQSAFFGSEAGIIEAWKDPFAPIFHSFAKEIRTVNPPDESDGDAHLWQEFLFWNPNAAAKSYKTLPLSHLAKGMEMGAVRSSWDKTAVWGAFMGGPHTNYPGAGEELPDKGSLAIVRGSRQLLVNSWAALLRNTPGTDDGGQYFDPLYNNVFGGNADVFNAFYAGGSPWGQGDHLRTDGNRTAMTRFEDGKTYVAMRSTRLEDNYPRNEGQPKSVVSWTRDVVYLRPELFVVYDRTTTAAASTPQWMNFHLAQPTTAGTAPATGIRRWDVGSGAKYAGSVETVLPAGHKDSVKGLFGKNKIIRLTVKPATAAKENRWLTVFDPAATKAAAARALPLTGARVKTGAVLGVCLRTSTKNYAVLAGTGAAGTPVAGEVRYTVPKAPTLHVVTDLQPNTAYTVKGSASASAVTVDLKPGTGIKASKTGVLSFQTSSAGAVSRATR